MTREFPLTAIGTVAKEKENKWLNCHADKSIILTTTKVPSPYKKFGHSLDVFVIRASHHPGIFTFTSVIARLGEFVPLARLLPANGTNNQQPVNSLCCQVFDSPPLSGCTPRQFSPWRLHGWLLV